MLKRTQIHQRCMSKPFWRCIYKLEKRQNTSSHREILQHPSETIQSRSCALSWISENSQRNSFLILRELTLTKAIKRPLSCLPETTPHIGVKRKISVTSLCRLLEELDIWDAIVGLKRAPQKPPNVHYRITALNPMNCVGTALSTFCHKSQTQGNRK